VSLISAIVIYEIGQIITGAASDSNAAIQIIVGRAIAGIGNGGIITLLFVSVTDVVPVSISVYQVILTQHTNFLTKTLHHVEERSAKVSRYYKCYMGYFSHRWTCTFRCLRR
jgi:hypothetical protein